MRRLTFAWLVLAALLVSDRAVTHAQLAAVQAPQPAQAVIAAAASRALVQGKAVLIEFGASWCVWCRSFEAFVKAPDSGPVIDRHFVVTNLTVRERDDKTALENPGGNELFERWGGGNAGLPFYVFLDGNGRKIADSNAMPDGTNIGFPAVPAEIAAFLGLVDRTAPRMTRLERGTLEAALLRMQPAR